MKIELTEIQLNNLITFLNRASLAGHEVMPFVEIMQILHQYRSQEPTENKGGDCYQLDK